jgi:hypothetical protein
MHQSLLGDHTTGSMIIDFNKLKPTIWLTGCSTPCLSIYKPTYFGVINPPVFANKEDSFDYWLKREYLVRAIYGGLISLPSYHEKLEKIQAQFIREENELHNNVPTELELLAFVQKCSEIEEVFVESYHDEIESIKQGSKNIYSIWKKKGKKLGKHVFATNFQMRNQC